MNLSEIHYPRSLQELMLILEQERKVQIVAGGTSFGCVQPSRYLSFDPSIVYIQRIPELRSIHKTERMISFGAACTLSELEHVYPFEQESTRTLLHTIGTPAVRNIATIGGHLMYGGRFLSLWALLACLDAELEFRTPSKTSTKNIWYLADEGGAPLLEPSRLLTRIRIPLQSIDHLFIQRIGGGIFPEGDGGYLVSAATIDRRMISNFKLVIAGARAYRDYDTEQRIVSAPHPLPTRIMQAATRMYAESLRRTNFWNVELLLPLISQALESLQWSNG
jgi:CO/xanthine dehydrogenase FAD-binding subunit